jgi:integrase
MGRVNQMAHSVPVTEWPNPDRQAWEKACQPNVRLQRGGRAAHLKLVTRVDLARRFGSYLDFLKRQGKLERDQSATQLITPDLVNAYIEELRTCVGSVTLHGMIYKLHRTAELLDPSLELSWLKEIELDLHDRMRPKSKADRLVFSGRIVSAGLNKIREADAQKTGTSLQRARCARDGLLIALLAVCPIRLKNLANLKIGVTFVQQGDQWWIVLPDRETKSGRPDHRMVPKELTFWIDLYLNKYRPAFPSSDDALWPSQYGSAMSNSGIYRLVTQTTKRTIGIAIGPHMFRHCVPYTIANLDGSRIGLASALLQHTDSRTTEKHYNLAHNVESSKLFTKIISNLKSSSTDEESGPVATYEPIPNRIPTQ